LVIESDMLGGNVVLIVFANCLTALPVAAGYNSRGTFGSHDTGRPNNQTW
jgi:hypothetical protein